MEISKLKCNWCKEKLCTECSAYHLRMQTESKLDPYIYENIKKYGNTIIEKKKIKMLGGESKVIIDIKANTGFNVRLRDANKKNNCLVNTKIIEII